MTCGLCDHSIVVHGRRGFGSCRSREWSEAGRKEAERIAGEMEKEGKDRGAVVRVLETLFALSGMGVDCTCKRFRATKAVQS